MQACTFKRGQIWEAGFDGLYNTDNAVDSVTSKVGSKKTRSTGQSTHTLHIQQQREREAFHRTVETRAEQFKNEFRKLDLDGDGKLSFEEFSCGLHSLGIVLPNKDLQAIWGQV